MQNNNQARCAEVSRITSETKITVSLNLDGNGEASVVSGIGFFDHMLILLANHARFDLHLKAEGDLFVDSHHTVEDCGIVFGQALRQAAGDKKGICRYGSFFLPMDETLALVTLDFSNRPFLVYEGGPMVEMCGGFASELVAEFLRAVANEAGLTLHVKVLYGSNTHHKIEAIFKGLGHALRMALTNDPRSDGIPSTKGVL